MPEQACQVLVEQLAAAGHKLTSFRRETPAGLAETPREPLAVAA
jgi:S-adenosylmethionine decarboxylase